MPQSENGIHYLAYDKLKARYDEVVEEYHQVSVQLQEAVALGDLKENSEYDAAKATMSKISRERDVLSSILVLPQIRSNNSLNVFEEGCVIELKIYSLTSTPMDTTSDQFKQMVETKVPDFEGVCLLGGTVSVQELLKDSALDINTPIGTALLGKQPGWYSVQVPGGFANLTAKKLHDGEFTMDDVQCVFRK